MQIIEQLYVCYHVTVVVEIDDCSRYDTQLENCVMTNDMITAQS